jgi:hypothetical protein
MLNDNNINNVNDNNDNNINNVNDKVIFVENNNNIKVLVVDFGEIEHLSWNSEDYLYKLLDLDLFKFVETNGDDLPRLISEELETDKYISNTLSVTTDIICEDKEYIYEIMYINFDKEIDKTNTNLSINHAAMLINTNGKNILSKAIIFKSYLPNNNNSMLLDNITKEDVINFMEARISTNIVLYENSLDFKEMKICGDLNKFAEEFFEGEGFKKKEYKFLLYNINIWYTTDCGTKDLFSKLIDNPLYSCIIFLSLAENIRGSISLDEVKKIINLSHKLSSFEVPEEYTQEIKDQYNRTIINNKYRILSKLYSKYN